MLALLFWVLFEMPTEVENDQWLINVDWVVGIRFENWHRVQETNTKRNGFVHLIVNEQSRFISDHPPYHNSA